jgi:deoxyribonuclease-1
MEADMYNLVPAIGEVNGLRSNYSFTMIDGEKREFGKCNMEIEDKKAEPPDNRFGDIARIYQYMDDVYPGHGIISDKNRKLFDAWIAMDPVDAWECERIKRIQEIQGNENHVTRAACQEAGMW